MKYIYIDANEIVHPVEELLDESCNVAMMIALGQDYDLFDIDPIEAFILVDRVKTFATEHNDDHLIKLIDARLDELRPHAQAFAICLETESNG